MKVPCHILLAAAHFSKYCTTQFSGSKANASLFPLVFQVPEVLPLFPIFTLVAVLCGGCQIPGKTSLTGLFFGDLLLALKCTKFVFEIPQRSGNNVIPVLHTSVVLCCDLCSGSCSAKLCAGGRAPHFVYVGATCVLKHGFLQEWKHEIRWHEQIPTDVQNKA